MEHAHDLRRRRHDLMGVLNQMRLTAEVLPAAADAQEAVYWLHAIIRAADGAGQILDHLAASESL